MVLFSLIKMKVISNTRRFKLNQVKKKLFFEILNKKLESFSIFSSTKFLASFFIDRWLGGYSIAR